MGMKASNKIATFFKYFVLILVGLIMIYPLLWMISATFKDNSEIFAGIGLWIKNPTLEGYKNALNNFGGSINILQAMLNTYSYVIPKVICTVVSACVAAYGFGRFDFPGRKLMFNIMLATLFLPQVVLNVPQYLLYNKFGWLDSPFYLEQLQQPVCRINFILCRYQTCQKSILHQFTDFILNHCPDCLPFL